MKRIVYATYSAAGGDRLVWRLASRRLRILAYHGICDDELARERWVPPYFVTRSAFDAQLAYLKRHACVRPLSEVPDPEEVRDTRDDLPRHGLYGFG
ncbi:MAG: hypothetical protein DMF88_18710 [Acidobacteria bacterium]|nr:MAG: hypothetical protein DMF88_18710 [Acidobacteriota bacterium]